MNPLRDEDRDPLQVWKRSLPEVDEIDEISESSKQEAIGTAATLTVIYGVVIVLLTAVVAGVIWLIKNRHLVGL